MKKIVISSLITLVVILFVAFIFANLQKESLNPQVAEVVANSLTIDEKTMQQNAFVALLGITVPSDDYVAVAKKVVINNAQKIKTALAQQDLQPITKLDIVDNYDQSTKPLTFNYGALGEDYKLPCRWLSAVDCIDTVVAQEKLLKQRMADNKLLLARYKHIIKLPYYDGYYMTSSSPTPNFGIIMRLSELRIAKAILLINENQPVDGLNLLQEEVTFYKSILAGKDSLIATMIATRQLYTLYHTVAVLLDRFQLADYLSSDLLKNLLTPLTIREQQAVASALEIERNGLLYLYLTLTNDDDRLLWSTLYDGKATANKVYQKFEHRIAAAKLVLPESAHYYLTHLQKQQSITNDFGVKRLRKEKGLLFFKNYYGEVLIEYAEPNYDLYLKRFYDVSSYLFLVETKWQIKQHHLNKKQISQWLLTHKVVNPYTLKPVGWQLAQQYLVSDWLEPQKANSDQWATEQAILYIDF